MRTISIARDFTPYPGGRYKRNGKGSGQEFREEFLVPLFKKNETAVIELEGASGYPPSFLEEAFGGLVREGYAPEEIKRRIRLVATPAYDSYTRLIWQYVERAQRLHAQH
ncbi:STAS-like domain-containing protein [Mesorhizobium sp. B2-8-5]|uniref:STAS-like domain-containing protein n=1 Tax=Mesorhizobium sp. B2-8-5 TaxID=2589903 RepID=UPI0015E3A9EC|nr:STAS-like domain-containing protein [Mesorhizobium sp. B2-8-5]UCI24589.1 STAS-like domain-containing protein [Mesorhizobium sp. B2-8-5]